MNKVKMAEVVSYISVWNESRLLTFHNVSDVEVTVELDGSMAAFSSIAFDTGHSAKLNGRQLILRSYTTVIMK